MNTDAPIPRAQLGQLGNKRVIVWLVLLLGLALGLRAATIAARGDLWGDEAITVMLISYGPADLLGRLAVPENPGATGVHVHPPVFYPLLRGWTLMFGDSAVGLRSFSAFFGVLSVLMLWLLLRRFFDTTLAWMSAAASAVSAVQIYYSSEARYYALFLFLTLVSLYYFLEIVKNGRGYFGYVIATTLCMYTFYYGMYVILSQNVLFLATGLWRDWKRLRIWVLTQIVVVLAFLPWVPVLRQHLRAISAVDFSSWSKYFNIMKGPLVDLMAFGGSAQVELMAAAAFALLVILGLLSPSSRSLRTAAFWLAWIVIPLVAHRYTGTIVIRTRAYIFLAPAVAVLAALPVVAYFKEGYRWRTFLAAVLFAVFLAANLTASVQTWKRTWNEKTARPSLTQLNDLLREEASPGSALILNRGKAITLVNCYLDSPFPTVGFWAYPGEDRKARVMNSLELLSEVFDEYWLVSTRGKGHPPWRDLVAERAPDALRVEYQYIAVQRVRSDIFRQSLTARNTTGWRSGDGVLSRVVVLGPDGEFNQRVDISTPTNVQIDILAKYPNRRPFHGVLEMRVDGDQVAAEKIGSDFAGLYHLEAELDPGSYELSVTIRDPRP